MSRRWLVAFVVLLVLAGSGWLALNEGYPRYRPTLRAGESLGVDVSAHQGSIDWGAVRSDGVNTAYVKATEGATFKDPQFAANWTGARDAGVAVGAYHFFTLCRDGGEQADNFLAALESAGGTTGSALPPVVDLELGGNCADRPPRATVDERLETFVSRVEERTGQRVVLYLLDNYASRYPLPADLASRERWVRHLVLRPGGEWRVWQVSNRARVAGIRGPVDLDVVAGPANSR